MASAGAVDGCLGVIDASLSTEVSFTDASPIGRPLKLCYRFGAGNFKLYSAFELSVSSINIINATVGDSGVAVVDVPKRLTFVGTGVNIGRKFGDNDVFKYVLRTTSELLPTVSKQYRKLPMRPVRL